VAAKPSVLITGAFTSTPDYEFSNWLARDGFKVRTLPGGVGREDFGRWLKF
jgi:hypothetical protein